MQEPARVSEATYMAGELDVPGLAQRGSVCSARASFCYRGLVVGRWPALLISQARNLNLNVQILILLATNLSHFLKNVLPVKQSTSENVV